MSDRVLVVHSHPLIAECVRRVALAIGAQALSSTSFSEAKRMIEQWHPLLVLADLALPDAFGEALPRYAKSRGVKQVWALSQEYKPSAYRRAPARDYGTDGWIRLSEVPRDLGPRLASIWKERFGTGRGDDTSGSMTRLCAKILQCSDIVQSWDMGSIRVCFDAWISSFDEHLGFEPDMSDALFYSAGLGVTQSEAV